MREYDHMEVYTRFQLGRFSFAMKICETRYQSALAYLTENGQSALVDELKGLYQTAFEAHQKHQAERDYLDALVAP